MHRLAACGYPNPANTGVPAGTTLTASGGLTISTSGTTINGKDITGCVTVNATNVIIKNSRIRCNGSWGVRSNSTGLLVQDTEVDNLNGDGTGLGGGNFVARRLNVHGGANGFSADSNVTIADSYIHDLWAGVDNHVDGIQVWSGSTGDTFDHNTILNQYGQTSAIIGGDGSTLTISNNLLAGGGYTLYCSPNFAGFKVNNNRWSKLYFPKSGYYGAMANCNSSQVKGAIWDDTGGPVPIG